ncbi:uncharacterized protein LOC144104246 isoform X3 [Amblyomma americanum]
MRLSPVSGSLVISWTGGVHVWCPAAAGSVLGSSLLISPSVSLTMLVPPSGCPLLLVQLGPDKTRSGPMVLRSCCCGSVISTIIKSGVFRRSLSCLSKASDLRYPRCPMIALLIFEERRVIILLPAMAALSVLDSNNLEERTPAIEQCSWVPDFPQKQIAVPVMACRTSPGIPVEVSAHLFLEIKTGLQCQVSAQLFASSLASFSTLMETLHES